MNKKLDVIYIRISDSDQNTIRQELVAKGKKIYCDKGVSGRIKFADRPKGYQLIKDVKLDRIRSVTFKEVDRMGRNLRDILKTVDFLKEHEIQIHILNLGLSYYIESEDGTRKVNPMFDFFITTTGLYAQMELDISKERQKEGIAAAKLQGKYKGRKMGSTTSNDKILDKYELVVKLLESKTGIRETAKLSGKSINTVRKVKSILDEQ